MTEPTRDALHAETLRVLSTYGKMRFAEQYAYAAECVRRVPELEAEVEQLRAKAAIVDAMERGEVRVTHHHGGFDVYLTADESRYGHDVSLLAAYAAATREGTDDA